MQIVVHTRAPAIDAIATMSEMDYLDLAPGDPISQDGSLRPFRYSQFSECPSPPFNSAEPECLPSQLQLSASLATSPPLELEDHDSVLNDGPLGEPSTSLLCSPTKLDASSEGVNCNTESGEHPRPGVYFEDSLRLSLFDAHPGSKKRESSPRRVYCDPGMLSEDTQVSDIGTSAPVKQASPAHIPVHHSASRKLDASSEGVYCNSESGEHPRPGVSFEDSLRLSLYDAHPGSNKRESRPCRVYCDPDKLLEDTQVSDVGTSAPVKQASPAHIPIHHSPRRMYCDPRFLEEETQVSDVVASPPLSPKQQLQSSSQAFNPEYEISEIFATLPREQEIQLILTVAAEPEKSLPSPAVKQERRGLGYLDELCQKYGSGSAPAATAIPRPSAGEGLPSETKVDRNKLSNSKRSALNHLRGESTGAEVVNSVPCAAKQPNSAAVKYDSDLAPNKRRDTLAATITDPDILANSGLALQAKQEVTELSTSSALDANHGRGQSTVIDRNDASASTKQEVSGAAIKDNNVDTVQSWHNRKRVALSAITNLSCSPDSDPYKKMKQTTEKAVHPGTGQVQTEQLEDPLSLENENGSGPQHGHVRPSEDATSPRSGSETMDEDVNVNDDTHDSCDSKLLQWKLSPSIVKGLQPVPARHKVGVSKAEDVEKKWTYPRINRPGGRQRTIDTWIK